VLGANGAGKTTFLRLVRGEIAPDQARPGEARSGEGGERLYDFPVAPGGIGDVGGTGGPQPTPLGLRHRLALVSGSIWGRAAWNVWWTWDPRLTTTLIMWFVYAGYLVLRGAGMAGERRAMVCAVLGVVAFLDVPLVFYSARIWRSVHPAVLASQGGGMEPEMWHTVW